ncbi:MAG: hypothetical protein HY696_03585 [Deltaproteobacteria bacterium]|nr:hypothetical protein [Deltaproteobacteria bacterium]
MKRFAMLLAVMVGVGMAGAAQAGIGSAIGGQVKDAAKKGAETAAKKAVEETINKRLASLNCSFKKSGTDTTCNLNKVAAELKAQHTVAEQGGFADFNINVTAYGPDSKMATQRADALRDKLKIIFGSWDYDVRSEVGGDTLNFSVKLN